MSIRRPTRVAAIAVGVLALTSLAACGGGDDDEGTAATPTTDGGMGGAEADATEVSIKGFKFAPADLTVPAGTELRVVNEDDAPHTLTASDGSFDTGNLDGGADGTISLDEAGEFEYRCEIHQYMRGSITVE